MVKKRIIEASIFIVLFTVFVTVFYYSVEPSLVGLVTTSQVADYEYTALWDFETLSDYSYDSSKINLSSGEAKLIRTTITTEWQEENITNYKIQQAMYNGTDEVSRLNSVDGQFLLTNDTFNVVFNGSVSNGFSINIYLLASNSSDIYLCDVDTACTSPGYGLVSFDGSAGLKTITVSGLSSAVNGFNIRASSTKFDYINATKTETVTMTNSTTSYPTSAKIETNDLTINYIDSFDSFSYNQVLNGNSVAYYYSVDSGSTWADISGLSGANTTNRKIRFKANLSSDLVSTPVISDMQLRYTTLTCIESWTESYEECLIDDTKLKYYNDTNNCGTTIELPADNGTTASCDYCSPSWSCLSYGSCTTSNVMTCAEMDDANDCYEITSLEADNDPTTYEDYTTSCNYNNTLSEEDSEGAAGGEGGGARRPQTENSETYEDDAGLSSSAVSGCEYSVSLSVPDEVSFAEENEYTAILENTGNCALENVQVELSNNFKGIVELSDIAPASIGAGEKATFLIKKKQEKLTGMIHGFAVDAVNPGIEAVKGSIVVSSPTQEGTEFKNNLPIILMVESSGDSGIAKKGALLTMIIASLALVALTYNINNIREFLNKKK